MARILQKVLIFFYHIEKYEYDPEGRGLAALTNNAINGQSLLKNIMEKRPASVRAAKNAPVVDFTKGAARTAKELAFNDIIELSKPSKCNKHAMFLSKSLDDNFNMVLKPTYPEGPAVDVKDVGEVITSGLFTFTITEIDKVGQSVVVTKAGPELEETKTLTIEVPVVEETKKKKKKKKKKRAREEDSDGGGESFDSIFNNF